MRRKRAAVNTLFSLLLEAVTLISGFIVPRLLIGTFGSEMNGMLHSITSFIGYITILQSGVGSVIKAALYKPLAKKDYHTLNIIIATVGDFFKKIAFITIGYVLLLAVGYPVLYAENHEFFFTASLVIIIGLSTIAQYYFGIVYQMLVEADMRSYIYSALQIATIIIHTVLTVVLIQLECSIHTVKLASALVFVMRPIVLNLYVHKKYPLNHHVQKDPSLLKQRWEGFAHAIAYFIHSKTDIFVLSTFSKLENVSVYGVYAMITTGLTAFVKAIDKAVGAVLGNIIASEERENLRLTFGAYNTFMHIVATTLFATAAVTGCAFIQIYTAGISDSNYIQPVFCFILISAEFLYCLRLPYNSVIYAAGLFKETRNSALTEAVINLCLSCLLVFRFGLIGVAIGTLAAMTYRIIYFLIFMKKHILMLPFSFQCKRLLLTLGFYTLTVFSASLLPCSADSYLAWFLYAGGVFASVFVITLLMNWLFFRKDLQILLNKFGLRAKASC